MNIGERIVQLRKEKNWSQKELARFIRMNVSVMNRIELGDRPVRGEELTKFATIFDVSTDYLLGRTENLGQEDLDEKHRIIEAIQEEFPDAELMFHDLAGFSSEEIQDVYDYIKFKKSQRENRS